MTTLFEGMKERVAQGLMDPGRLVWTEAALDEAVRLALAEYNLALHAQATLEGLDGATATSLPAGHEGLLALGAAAHAAAIRLAGRFEAFPAAAEADGGLAGWAQARREAFRQGLEQVRAGGLRAAEAAPWAQAGWKLDAWEEG